MPSIESQLAGNVADLPELALRTLQGILSNILQNPTDQSRCRIRTEAPTYITAIRPYRAAQNILRTVGFVKKGDVLLARSPFFDVLTTALEMINNRLPDDTQTTPEEDQKKLDEALEKVAQKAVAAMAGTANVFVRALRTPSTAALKSVFAAVPAIVEARKKVVVVASTPSLALRGYACLRSACQWFDAAPPVHVFGSLQSPLPQDAKYMGQALRDLGVIVTLVQNSKAVTSAANVALLVLISDDDDPIEPSDVAVPKGCRVVALGPDGLQAITGTATEISDVFEGPPAPLPGTITAVTEALIFHLLYRRDPKQAAVRLLQIDTVPEQKLESGTLMWAVANALGGAHELLLMFLVHLVLRTGADPVKPALPNSVLMHAAKIAADAIGYYPVPSGKRVKQRAMLATAIVAFLIPMLHQTWANRVAKPLGVTHLLTPVPDNTAIVTYGDVPARFFSCVHAALVHELATTKRRKWDTAAAQSTGEGSSVTAAELEAAFHWKGLLQPLFGPLSRYVNRQEIFTPAAPGTIRLVAGVQAPEVDDFPLQSEFMRQSAAHKSLAVESVLAAMPDGDGEIRVVKLLMMVGPSFKSLRRRHCIRAASFREYLMQNPDKFIVDGRTVRRVKPVSGHVPVRAAPPMQNEKDGSDNEEDEPKKKGKSKRRLSLKHARWAAKQQIARRASHAAMLRKIGVKKKGHHMPAKRGRGVRGRTKMAYN